MRTIIVLDTISELVELFCQIRYVDDKDPKAPKDGAILLGNTMQSPIELVNFDGFEIRQEFATRDVIAYMAQAKFPVRIIFREESMPVQAHVEAH